MIVTVDTKLAGVMGWPVGHSRSPRLHGFWLERYRIDGLYLPLAVEPSYFAQALRILARIGFAGVNVTLPHKEVALRAVDETSPLARRIGAVNTVTVRRDGSLYGTNTDAFGFIESVKAGLPAWSPTAAPALVLGAGGGARAVCAALLDEGAPEVRLVNRRRARSEALARDMGERVKVFPWVGRQSALEGVGLVVNATSLGMVGQPPLELEVRTLGEDAAVADLVYEPLETALLKAAKARGLRTVDGLGMLLHQARPGFAAWFGVEPEVTDELRTFVAADQGG